MKKQVKIQITREELFDPTMMITISAVVEGDADREKLEAAFKKAVSSYEILNTKIVIDEHGDAFYESPVPEDNVMGEVLCNQSNTGQQGLLTLEPKLTDEDRDFKEETDIDRNKQYWEKKEDTDRGFKEKHRHESNSPESRVYYTDKTIEELIPEQEKNRFRIEDGEYLRLFVDDSKEGELKLHFFMHHVAGDGKSLCYFIESFLKCLNGEALEYKKMFILNISNFPKEGRLKPIYKWYAAGFNHKWKKEEKIFGIEDIKRAHECYWKSHKTEVEFSYINEKELKEILEECHKKGFTFTSYCIADYMKNRGGTGRVGFAVDIRQDKAKLMGNYVSGSFVEHNYNEKISLADNAAAINEKIKAGLKNPKRKYFVLHFLATFESTLLNAVILESAGVFHSRLTEKLADITHYGENSKNKNDIGVSNLGVADIQTEYGNFIIKDFRFIPPKPLYEKEVMGIVTVNGRACITRHSGV